MQFLKLKPVGWRTGVSLTPSRILLQHCGEILSSRSTAPNAGAAPVQSHVLKEMRWAVNVTPTGRKGLHFDLPGYARAKKDSVTDHCSAFAATGPATRDGKMIVGHVTWWPKR